MKKAILSIAAACLLLLAAGGCSKPSTDMSSADADITVGKPDESGDLSFIDSLGSAVEFLDGSLKFEENYIPYFDNDQMKSYMIKEEKAVPLSAESEITVNGKSAQLPISCKSLEDKFSLRYADKNPKHILLSGGATAAREFETKDGKTIRLALFSEKSAKAEDMQVIGALLGGDLSFSALGGINEKTSIPVVIERLGLPDYVSMMKADEGINIDLQYTSGDFARIIYNSLTGMSSLAFEIE